MNKADALSWRPDHDDGSGDNEKIVVLPDSLFARVMEVAHFDKDMWERQKEDKDVWEEWKCIHDCEEIDKALYKDGALVVTTRDQFYKDILQNYHDSVTAGHPGVWKTWQAIKWDYWWPGLRQYVARYVKGCAVCQQNKTVTTRNTPPLQPIVPEEGSALFSTIAMDFVVKLPESRGLDSILTVTDQGCTKAVILVPCRENMGSEEIAELFKECVFPYAGIPQKLIFDRDTRFTSAFFKELCNVLGVQQNTSTTYHPQTDGQSERTNQTMEDLLRIFSNYQQDNWADWLPVVQYIINSRPSSTTKKAPFKLWMGHIPPAHQANRLMKIPQLWKRRQVLKEARDQALKAIETAQAKCYASVLSWCCAHIMLLTYRLPTLFVRLDHLFPSTGLISDLALI